MPFSARATVIFALAGTYLGSGWVVSIYVFDLVVIGLTGRIISDRLKTVGMGFIMDIPPYRLPHLKQENLVQSRFTMLVKVSGKDRTSVVTALSQHVCTLPTVLRRSLTWDRGMELAQHKRLTVDTGCRSTFATPKAPGNVAPMKTQTVCCVSASRNAPTSHAIPRPTWIRFRYA